jgi:hypothetical protein
MVSSTKLVTMRPRLAPKVSALTPELKGFIDRVIVPILVRDHLSGIAQEKQIADIRDGVASCESMTVSPDAEGPR